MIPGLVGGILMTIIIYISVGFFGKLATGDFEVMHISFVYPWYTAILGIILIQSVHRDRAADPVANMSVKNQSLKSETNTTRDIGCYILGSTICDENGKKQDLYQKNIILEF